MRVFTRITWKDVVAYSIGISVMLFLCGWPPSALIWFTLLLGSLATYSAGFTMLGLEWTFVVVMALLLTQGLPWHMFFEVLKNMVMNSPGIVVSTIALTTRRVLNF